MFNNLFSTVTLATATTAGANSAGGKLMFGMTSMLIPIIFVVYVVYDMRQRKKITKKHKEMLDSAKEGDKVVTIGGLRGEIASINEKTFELKVDKGIRLEFERKAIARVEK